MSDAVKLFWPRACGTHWHVCAGGRGDVELPDDPYATEADAQRAADWLNENADPDGVAAILDDAGGLTTTIPDVVPCPTPGYHPDAVFTMTFTLKEYEFVRALLALGVAVHASAALGESPPQAARRAADLFETVNEASHALGRMGGEAIIKRMFTGADETFGAALKHRITDVRTETVDRLQQERIAARLAPKAPTIES